MCFDGHPCPANRLSGHFPTNMTDNEIWRSPMSGKRRRNPDRQEEGQGGTCFDGHPCPANRFVGHFSIIMADNEICRSPVSGKRHRTPGYSYRIDHMVTDYAAR